MLKSIKAFLIRWDLLPILWPFGPQAEAGFIGAILGAVAPAVASWISGRGQEKDQRAQAEAAAQYQHQQQQAQARAAFDARQNSPQAQAARHAATLRYGRLAGAMGGLDRVPGSLASYYSGARTPQEYQEGAYVAPEIPGSSWQTQLSQGLSYFDPRGIKKAWDARGGGGAPEVPQVDTSQGFTAPPQIDTGFWSGGGKKPFDPKIGG